MPLSISISGSQLFCGHHVLYPEVTLKKKVKFTVMSLFQNPVGFGTSSWKNRSNRTKVRPGFSPKFKVAVPKAEVLEQPLI
jgi:hypothetical protein